MQKFIDILLSPLVSSYMTANAVVHLQGHVNEYMKLDGWAIAQLFNKQTVLMKFNNGDFMNEGYVFDQEKVLKVFEDETYNVELTEEGTVIRDDGSRFEGALWKGIPFGNGRLYDANGTFVYLGIVINWKRIGWGASVAFKEEVYSDYLGPWSEDTPNGYGLVFDENGKLVRSGMWYNGKECDSYEGDGNNLSIGVENLKLSDMCILKDWDISLFISLQSIEIGDSCFSEVKTFRIEYLSELRSLKIGSYSFTLLSSDRFRDASEEEVFSISSGLKSFFISNCNSLETIEVGIRSFFDYCGEFELKNLPQLQSIKIGEIGTKSSNFVMSSLVIQGILVESSIEFIDLPNLQSMIFGDSVFSCPPLVRIEGIRELDRVSLK